MRRRTFFAVLLVFLGSGFAGLAAASGQGTSGYGYALVAAGHLGLAAYYRFGTDPIDDPDEPVPRRWVELAAVAVASLVVGVCGFGLVSSVF